MANADAHGLARERFTPLSFDTGKLTAGEFSNVTGRAPLRFIHIDGDHSPKALTQDLRLAQQSLHPEGLICIDDMLHPAFPFLVVVVRDHLKQNPEMRLLCVIDRESGGPAGLADIGVTLHPLFTMTELNATAT